MAQKIGPLVHLWGIDPSQLPAETASGTQLIPLLTGLLSEALPFIHDVPAGQGDSSSSWKFRKTHSYPTSAASVGVYEKKIPADAMRRVAADHAGQLPQVRDAGAETWFLRRSVHEDAARRGTASWEEFVAHFKAHHAESEMGFTTAIVGTTPRRSWDCAGLAIRVGGETWTDWTLQLEESVHRLPFPLRRRVFPVLQATAAVDGRREFVVVQVFYAGEPAAANAHGTVTGAYTSIERVRELPGSDDGKKQIEWIMGTASDARGILPEFIQAMATPDLVPKDVEFFLSWVVGQRK
ncbi:hypothetical protein ISF_00437 [Cordyceps fumosorosea ARSEF 2679]|uniref:DUF3074 domain-containing protein n=1 Tax=Cordyceps fumosorosea (strain ARSEF 2679) TaxID=1081104 RepID=A0A168E9E7_CORFA|nr:hypothetical protein ISF_00437 [Cordyceps fumosorosea ARSEF 2679]OAA73536.1 hypothetical protein ISF_00437 [Cordyceps fumosorosea ARSEF 2679]